MANTLSLFNLQWYLDQNPDVKEAVEAGLVDGFEHFQLHGQQEGRSPGPLFDSVAYLKNNSDVAAAVNAGQMTAYEHFINYGASEGRSPINLFDAEFYLQQNADVSEAVEAGGMSAVEHFLLYGQNEARSFSPSIDLGKYMTANPDVAKAVEAGGMSAMEHLLLYGVNEGRDLGNGVNLGIFAEDPKFADALEAGDIGAALGRVAEVAPFLPGFESPSGWKPAPNTPIPVDFTPPEGTKLVVPEGVVVPDDMELPDTFEPVEPAEPEEPTLPPQEPKEFTLTEALAAKEADELPETYILTDTVIDLGVLAIDEFDTALATSMVDAIPILMGASNAGDLELDKPRYQLADSLENIQNEENADIVDGAESYAVIVTPSDSIQEIVDKGMNVWLGAGVHTGMTNLSGISENLKISGANAGLAGKDDSREDEAILDAGASKRAVDVPSGTHQGDVMIDGVKVLAGSNGGIVQGYGDENTGELHVVNSVIIAPDDGFSAGGNGVLLSGQGSSVKDSKIEMTPFSTPTPNWSTSGVAVFDYASGAEISGNYIYALANAKESGSITGIGLDTSFSPYVLDSVTILDNTLESLTSGVTVMGNIEATIEGNLFKDNTTAISLGSPLDNYDNEFVVTITGNTFDGNDRAVIFQDVDGDSVVTIADNTFVDASDMQDSIVFNFVVKDPEPDASGLDYDRFDDLTVKIDITQFKIGGALAEGVLVASGTDWESAGTYLLLEPSAEDKGAGTATLAWDFDGDDNVDLTIELTGLTATDFEGTGYMALFG